MTEQYKKFTEMRDGTKVKFDPDYEMQYLNFLQSKLYNDYDIDNETLARNKRDYENTDWGHYLNHDSQYSGINYNKMKKNMKIFGKSYEKKTPKQYSVDSSNSQLDVTIFKIDNDAVKFATTRDEPGLRELENDFKMNTNVVKISEQNSKLKHLPNFRTMHNELLYDAKDQTDEMEAFKITNLITDNVDQMTTPKLPLFAVNTFPFPTEVLNQLPEYKNENPPKRIMIFGNSYRYDVVYHDPEKSTKITNYCKYGNTID